jgi:hypothetical protein
MRAKVRKKNMMDSNITLNPVRKTKRQIITTLEEDGKRELVMTGHQSKIQHRHLTTAGVSYYDQK